MIESRAPRRMRHSWEARCRLAVLMLGGVSPSQAAIACGAGRATAYRALARYRVGGWEALRDRPPIAKSHPARLSCEAERQIVELRRATGWGAQTPGRGAGLAGGDDLARAAPSRHLASSGRCAAAGQSLRVRRSWRARTPRHQAARSFLAGRQTSTRRSQWQTQPRGWLELPAPRRRRSFALRRGATAPHTDQQRCRGLSRARTRALRRPTASGCNGS
jgi:hypothetical protein